jgi:hypothetical protein
MGFIESTRMMSTWRGWWPIMVLPIFVLMFTPPEWPRWLFMWALAFVIFVSCKWLTWRRTRSIGLPWWLHVGYLMAWPGLDAKAFLRAKGAPTLECPSRTEWGCALLKLFLGATLFFGVSRLVPEGWEILLGWVGMVGLVLMMHFGSFHLLSCVWRSIGVEARPLMNNPLAAVRVSDFWGERWNTAFRDLTYRFLFRPLTKNLGPKRALGAGFLFSGLVHDLVISVPASGGYGGPTLFFAIQALAILVERSQFGESVGLGHGWRGRIFTLLVLALPAFGLFHPPFVVNIIVPFMRALGAV